MTGKTEHAARTVYASQANIPMTSGFKAGPDATAALQAILDTAGEASPLELVIDGVCSIKGLKVRSCTTIRGLGTGSGLFLLPGSGTYAITNANHTSSYVGPTQLPDFSGSMIVDHDITIGDLRIDVNCRGGSNGHASCPYINPTGRMIHGIALWGVRRARIHAVVVHDPPCYGISIGNCFHGSFTNIEVVCPQIANYQAAIQVQGPSFDLYVSDLRGSVGDDFLALNAADGNLSQRINFDFPSGPQANGGFTELYYGPIQRVTARGIYPNCCGSALRLLSGKDCRPGARGPVALIDQIDISNVVGKVYWHAFLANTFDDLGPGEFGKIFLSNWQVDMIPFPPTGVPDWFRQHNDGYAAIGGTHHSLVLSNHIRGTMGAARNSLLFNSDAVVGECRISGMSINETSPSVGTDAIRVEPDAKVRLLRVMDCSWHRRGEPAHAMVKIVGGHVGDLQVRDLHLDGVKHVIAGDSGSIGNANITGLVLRNSGSAAPIETGEGMKLQCLVGAANDPSELRGHHT